jgi:iron-sulfur cluster assembly protein
VETDAKASQPSRRQLVTITPAASDRIKMMIQERDRPTEGVRLGVRARGCSGMSYTLDFVEARPPQDDVVDADGIRLFIDPKAAMFVAGTEMDYVNGDFESGFVFRNPNEKGRCGCGESFRV